MLQKKGELFRYDSEMEGRLVGLGLCQHEARDFCKN